ncbi:MAG: nitronate monooxygenase [Rudaea sp.]|nr:nitronate monooxygenase [Rudaea sp.]
MAFSTALNARLKCATPILQAPMAGGGDTPDLVAAVCAAGGFGFVGAAYLQPAQIAEVCRAVRQRTRGPYGINLFAHMPAPRPDDVAAALACVTPYFDELGLPPPSVPDQPHPDFGAQLEAVSQSDASAFSFTFGQMPAAAMQSLKARGIFVLGTATTVDEAIALAHDGVDAVIAQGAEAGGHRGTFAASFDAAMVGTMALVPQVVDAIRVPVVASGGIMDGRGIAAALALGASGVQLGTAFLTCDEAGVPEAYKRTILAASETDTIITRAFSGRPARGIGNRFMEEVGAAAADAILPFPWQNALTRPLRRAAATAQRAEFLSLWAGQGMRLARRQSTAELMRHLIDDCDAALRHLSRHVR